MEFEKGEGVEWIVADKAHLILSRQQAPPNPVSVKKRLAPRRLRLLVGSSGGSHRFGGGL
jgi:hypothetical protein